ncbi:anti-sigma factor [Pseudomonas putida]|uniref:Anti-sigma factor n=1 Tax=Pseudomonas putida TaxID=303 RepID=A0A2Z4RGL3_PSEPU|nr:anti-sigma factor [Pseudomonas putida]AWY40291.1 anti-sigma factor [Pseudomonas putida]
MNELDCTVCQTLIQGYLDKELDPPTTTKVAGHLAECAACAHVHDQAKLLVTGVKQSALYYRAPASLAASVFPAESPKPGFIERWRSWFAPAFSVATLALAVMLFVATPGSEQPLMDEAVSSHVRSLMGEHLNDVVSSDRHTVKPWFTGKLDFSPPVFDYKEQGFPLLGGRLDYLQHQTTAALSYGRNKHIINVFILPTTEADKPAQSESIRGFNVVSWQQGHMRYVLVSDVEKSELEVLGQLLKNGA